MSFIVCLKLIQSKLWLDGLIEWREQGKVFEGLTEGEGQATAWRLRDQGQGGEEIVLVLSRGIRQAMQSQVDVEDQIIDKLVGKVNFG
jgi:hypothetical protein